MSAYAWGYTNPTPTNGCAPTRVTLHLYQDGDDAWPRTLCSMGVVDRGVRRGRLPVRVCKHCQTIAYRIDIAPAQRPGPARVAQGATAIGVWWHG